MAADARHCAAALWHMRGGVVRAAGAEGRDPVCAEVALFESGLLGLQEGEAGADAIGSEESVDARGDHARNHRRGELAGRGQQPFAVIHSAVGADDARPFALLVEFADDARTHVLTPVVKLLLELVFEQLALLLNHQDLVKPRGEMAHAVGFERPHHTHLVQAYPDLGGERVVDAKVVEGLSHIEIALAAGDDPETRGRGVDDDAVQSVRARIGKRGVELVVQQALFLHQRRIGPADVESVRRQREIGRNHHLHAIRVNLDRG